MIEALREIGIVCGKKSNEEDNLAQNPFLGKEALCRVINICLRENQDEYFLNEVRLEDFDNENYTKYLYKEKSSQGAHYTPCAKITDNIEKTLNNRIYSWFKNIKSTGSNREDRFLKIKQTLEKKENKEKLIHEIGKNLDRKNTNYLLTISINNKYLGEIKEFREELANRYSEKLNTIYTEKGVCSLCSAKGHVFGNVSPLTSYTLDKQSYIAGGFEKIQGWKNFPLCSSCKDYLEQGKNFMKENLSFSLGGVPYYQVPRCIKDFEKNLQKLIAIYKHHKDKKIGFKNEKLQIISEQEKEDILPLMQEEDDYFLLNFLFVKEKNQEFKIRLLLEEIYPSRLRKIFEAKKEADKHLYLRNIGKDKFDIKFHFGILKDFTTSIEQYLSLIEKIFKKIPIDKALIINLVIEKIRETFKKEGDGKKKGKEQKKDKDSFHIKTLKGQITLNFLLELGVIHNNLEVNEMSEIPFRNELVKKFEHFFKENEKSFTNYQTKAAFSTGILSKNFLDIQRKKRGSTPFSKQFRNFKMNEKNIREVYTEIVTKLLEYDIHYRNIEQLKEIVSWYLSKAGEKWNISISEINYYFALGFSLDKIFENKKEEEHETGK